MARHTSPAVQWAQYLGARFAAMGLTTFDVETNLRSAEVVGRGMYRMLGRSRERTKQHLRLSFPHWSRQRVDSVALKVFEHLALLGVEVCHTPRLIHRDSWSNRVSLKNVGEALERLNTGRPVILITGHVGNWEVLGYLLAVVGYQVNAVARPLNNPLINDWLLGIRQQKGLRVITKWDATQQMIDVLNSGGALGFIADQNAGTKGLFVPFFGRLASTYKSVGLLALSQKVPLVCGYARRLRHLGYRFEFGMTDIIYPEDWENQPDPLYYVTARYMRAIESMIRICPEQYLWMHRRWKSRPRHELQGKPLPKALRRQLENLPWMDQATLDRLATSPCV